MRRTLGTVDQIYFDDFNLGRIRYLTDSTDWLGDRKVLISPFSFIVWIGRPGGWMWR